MGASASPDDEPGRLQSPPADRLAAARQALAAAEEAAAAEAPAITGSAVAEQASDGGAAPIDGGSASQDGTSEALSAARQIVLRQLAVGPRTRHQLATKLRDRGCADDVAAQVLDRMTEVGLVDDQSFAEMTVRSRQQTKGLAAPALRHELRRKGVADDVIEGALQDVDPHRERAQAEELVAKRLGTMQGLDREVQTRRLAGVLARKGYSAGVSYEVIRDALDNLPEHHRD